MFVKFNTVVNKDDLKIERLGNDIFIFRPNSEYERKNIQEVSFDYVKNYDELEEILKNRNESIADFLIKRV